MVRDTQMAQLQSKSHQRAKSIRQVVYIDLAYYVAEVNFAVSLADGKNCGDFAA